MLMAITTTVSALGAVALLVAVLLVGVGFGFVMGRSSKEVKEQPLPTKQDLEAMTETLVAWSDLANKISGWNAAVYGAAGVILGAAGGLTAEWVAKGSMSAWQIVRALVVMAVLILLVTALIWTIEHFRIVEKLLKKG